MNKDVKEKWLAALRSGEYKQNVGVLHNPDKGYCCLGVLCHIAEKEGIVCRNGEDHDGDYKYDDMVVELPHSVMNWAGLDTSMGILPSMLDIDGEEYASLATLNDDAGYTFQQIADVIDEQL